MFDGFLKVSTARNVLVLMVDSADHITGKTGRTLAIQESKNGGAFATCSASVTERTFGMYQVALDAGNTNTKGDYLLHFSATSCDPSDYRWQVVTDLPGDTIDTATNLTNAPTNGDLTATMKTSVTTAATAATPIAASVTGNVGGNVTGSVGSVAGNVVGSVASVTSITASGGIVSSDIKKVNGTTVNGSGTAGSPWGP